MIIEGIPNGWEAVAFKPPVVGEHVFTQGMVILVRRDRKTPYLVIKRVTQDRIIFKKISAEKRIPNNGEYVSRRNGYCLQKCTKEEEWWGTYDIFERIEEEPSLRITAEEAKIFVRHTVRYPELRTKLLKFIAEYDVVDEEVGTGNIFKDISHIFPI